jgi:hypothetical protein
MAWGEWMCQDLSLSAQLALEHQKRVIQSEGIRYPEKLAKLCCQLIDQDARRQVIIKGAIKRIAELECEIGLMAEDDYQNED